MKKVFTIAIALSALGMILTGCGAKTEEGAAPAETAGATAGGDAAKPAEGS